MRCLANALLLKEAPRQMLVDLGIAPKASEMLKVWQSLDDLGANTNGPVRVRIQATNSSSHEYFFS